MNRPPDNPTPPSRPCQEPGCDQESIALFLEQFDQNRGMIRLCSLHMGLAIESAAEHQQGYVATCPHCQCRFTVP